ncbi:MAG: hypothetical protein WEE89_04360 [Gemmatimonadota bacterium]
MNPGDSPADQRPSLLPVIIGIGLAGALILGLGFWVARRPAAAGQQPEVRIISPAGDTTTDGSVTLRFATSRPLELVPTGWGAGRYHLHAMVNGVERMPAASAIRPLSAGDYQWTLSELPDSAEVQLVWALPTHQQTGAGSSARHLIRRDRP